MTGGAGQHRPRRITLVNQFYPPDLSPTAHLTASLAEHLASRGDDVTVLTGGEGYVEHRSRVPPPKRSGRVRVSGLWTPALGKASMATRLSDYVSFLAGATVRMLGLRRQDVVIALTTPPFVVVAALAHRVFHRHAKVVLWSMDCYPDVIERLGSRTGGAPVPSDRRGPQRVASAAGLRALKRVGSLREGGPMSRLLRAVNRWVFRRLDHVVALDEAMRELLLDGYGSGDGKRPPSSVIPNWEPLADFPAVASSPAGDSHRGNGDDGPALDETFVVLYLGNLGFGHRIETVIGAAEELTTDDDVSWLFVGGGARWDELRAAANSAGISRSIVQRDYVSKARTPAVLAAADCALILLSDEALGLMSPSKLHANLAAGLPIVYVGPTGSNVAEAIEAFDCGISLRTGDVAGLADAIRRLRDDPQWRATMSARARTAFEAAYCDEVVLPRWDAVLDRVLGTPAPKR